MKLRQIALTCTLILGTALTAFAGDKSMNLADVASKIADVEKTQITLEATIVGTCKSGCKMWVADGQYSDGDLYALVRAKDEAFKFDINSTGKTCVLTGFAVGEFLDYCADQGKEHDDHVDVKDGHKHEDGATEKSGCATPVGTKGKKELKDITFFATSIEYK